MKEIISEFLNQSTWAVIGVSTDPSKYGHKIFNQLVRKGYSAFPINPNLSQVNGNIVYGTLNSLPIKPDVVITVVPPKITTSIVKDCVDLGIGRVWMQPGSEDSLAIELAKEYKIAMIHNHCILIELAKKPTTIQD